MWAAYCSRSASQRPGCSCFSTRRSGRCGSPFWWRCRGRATLKRREFASSPLAEHPERVPRTRRARGRSRSEEGIATSCPSPNSSPRIADGPRGSEWEADSPSERAPAWVGDGHAHRLTERVAVCLPEESTCSAIKPLRWTSRAESSGCGTPPVPVMKTTRLRSSDDLGGWIGLRLHSAHRRRILLQGQVRAVVEVG